MAIFKLIVTKKMLMILPFIFQGAMNLAAMAAVYINFWTFLMGQHQDWMTETQKAEWDSMEDRDSDENKPKIEDWKNANALYTFITFGFGAIFAGFVLGFLQDRFGHKASICFLLVQYVVFYIIFLIQNESGVFNWTAHVTMFGMGMIFNSQITFRDVLIGFEFPSKIVAFGVKNVVENVAAFLMIGAVALW